MELEWNPLGKPMPGHEAEFLRLFKLMRSLRTIDPDAVDRASLDRRWLQIQVTPHETLGAPRVGTDAAADQWAVARYREWKPPTQSKAEFMQEMQGFYVLDLVPACDGLPAYSNAGSGGAELFSFNAQLLQECEEVIGHATLQACYRSGLARGLEALGNDMLAMVTHFAERTHVTPVETLFDPGFEEGSTAKKVHIVLAAAKWCHFWSAHGHGLAAHWLSKPA